MGTSTRRTGPSSACDWERASRRVARRPGARPPAVGRCPRPAATVVAAAASGGHRWGLAARYPNLVRVMGSVVRARRDEHRAGVPGGPANAPRNLIGCSGRQLWQEGHSRPGADAALTGAAPPVGARSDNTGARRHVVPVARRGGRPPALRADGDWRPRLLTASDQAETFSVRYFHIRAASPPQPSRPGPHPAGPAGSPDWADPESERGSGMARAPRAAPKALPGEGPGVAAPVRGGCGRLGHRAALGGVPRGPAPP